MSVHPRFNLIYVFSIQLYSYTYYYAIALRKSRSIFIFFVRNLANTINCLTKTFDVVLVSFGLIVASVYTLCQSKRNNSDE